MARPRKHTYDAATSRTSASTQALHQAGGATLLVNLQPDARRILDELQAETGESKTAIINRLLRAAKSPENRI